MLTAHSPDNSFAGFVVERYQNDTQGQGLPRRNIALVYGKDTDFWKVCVTVIGVIIY